MPPPSPPPPRIRGERARHHDGVYCEDFKEEEKEKKNRRKL